MIHKQIIRIEQCSNNTYWYKDKIGDLFAVLGTTEQENYIVGFANENYDFDSIIEKCDAVTVTGKEHLYMIPVIDLNDNCTFDTGWIVRAGFKDLKDFYTSVGHGETLLNLVVKDYRGNGDDDILLDIPFADNTVQGIYKGLDEDDIEGGGFKLLEYITEEKILEVVMAKTWKIHNKEYVYWLDVYGINEVGVES